MGIEKLKTFKFHFHSFKKYLASIYFVLGPVSGARNLAVTKQKRNFYPYGVCILVGRVQIKPNNKCI